MQETIITDLRNEPLPLQSVIHAWIPFKDNSTESLHSLCMVRENVEQKTSLLFWEH